AHAGLVHREVAVVAGRVGSAVGAGAHHAERHAVLAGLQGPVVVGYPVLPARAVADDDIADGLRDGYPATTALLRHPLEEQPHVRVVHEPLAHEALARAEVGTAGRVALVVALLSAVRLARCGLVAAPPSAGASGGPDGGCDAGAEPECE